jgi:protein ImuB
MVLAVVIPQYTLAVALRACVEAHATPLLVVNGNRRVVDVTSAASALGAFVGQTATQARACVPEATIILDDAQARAQQWEEILNALDAVSPLIENAGEGTAFIDIRGDARLALDIARDALSEFPFVYHLGAGSNRWIARAAARVEGYVCAPGDEAALAASLPISSLPDLDPRTARQLALLGITTLGQIAALPHGPFIRRFGPRAARRHALARGIDDTPLIPRPRRLRIERARAETGDGGIQREDQLVFALRDLTTQVAADLAFAGRRCGKLVLVLELDDATTHRVEIGIAEPTARAMTLLALVRARLENLRLAAPVVALSLGAQTLVDAGHGASLSFFMDTASDAETLAVLLARLRAIVGMPTLRAELAPGHRLETQHRFQQFVPPSMSDHATTPTFRSQLRLVVPPRRISVVARRDGSPKSAAGSSVLEYAGPWRSDETLRHAADNGYTARDEYDVLLRAGALWRIARADLRWVLLGIYG